MHISYDEADPLNLSQIADQMKKLTISQGSENLLSAAGIVCSAKKVLLF